MVMLEKMHTNIRKVRLMITIGAHGSQDTVLKFK